MDRSVEAIWRARARAFRRESMPYLRYMAQSGVPGVVSLLLLTGLAGYVMLLRNVPASFPFTFVGTLVLAPVVCWSPMRTWLREPDIVFLLPREAEMGRYLQLSFRYNGTACIALAALVCASFLPLYVKGPCPLAAPLLLAAVVLLKAANAAGAWQERRLAWNAHRRGVRLLRWAATAVALAALLQTAPWKAAVYTIAAAGIMAALYSRLHRHRLPWMRLIAEETRTRRRYNVFFSAFSDVPAEKAQVAVRRYLSWTTAFVRYRKENAYLYLYAHTLIRTELGGILLRLTAFGVFSGWLAASSGLWSGWGAAGVYVLFVWLTGIQLGSLAQAHSHSVWRHVYPLPESSHLAALLKVDRAASLACAVILCLPLALLLAGQGYGWTAAVSGLIAALYIFLVRPARLKRAFAAAAAEGD